jgi:hypothetical protein
LARDEPASKAKIEAITQEPKQSDIGQSGVKEMLGGKLVIVSAF